MDLCQNNKAISKEVKNFILNVGDIKEESITDYLVWKWKEIDKKFNVINVSTFTRNEENKITGADFEMEIWVVGNTKKYPLVIQAKKFIKPYDSYVSKLNYPKNNKQQMTKLLEYAKNKNKIPFYMIYSLPDKATKSMCKNNDVDECGVFLIHANIAKEFSDKKHGKKVSKNNILEKSNPFHCIFCCPLSRGEEYFSHYYNIENDSEIDTPEYVNYLLNTHPAELDDIKIKLLISEYQLTDYKYVAVYDMRK